MRLLKFQKYFGFLFLIVIVSCNQYQDKKQDDSFDHIDDEKVKSILIKSIEKAGGIQNWKNITSIKYTKHSKLFYEDGTVEQDVIQRHEYSLQPYFTARISWKAEDNKHLIEYGNESVSKYVNEVRVQSDEQSLRESVMSSFYVLGMPFLGRSTLWTRYEEK